MLQACPGAVGQAAIDGTGLYTPRTNHGGLQRADPFGRRGVASGAGAGWPARQRGQGVCGRPRGGALPAGDAAVRRPAGAVPRLLARLRRPIPDGAVPDAGGRRIDVAGDSPPRRSGPLRRAAQCPAHAGGRIPRPRSPGRGVERPGSVGAGRGCRLRRRAIRLPQTAGPALAPSGSGLLPFGREPTRRGLPLRLPGDLCPGRDGRRSRPVSAAQPRAAGIGRGAEQDRPGAPALARAVGLPKEPTGEGVARLGGPLPGAGVDAASGLSVLERGAGPRGERRPGPPARLVEKAPPPPRGHQDRRPETGEVPRRRDARFPAPAGPGGPGADRG